MEEALTLDVRLERHGRLQEIFGRERRRLLEFIRKRVRNSSDAEDIVQDVFYKLLESYELLKPVEHVSAWLYQTAKHRIIDLFRRDGRRPATESLEKDENFSLADILPSPDAGPDELYVRTVLLEEVEAALNELPKAQRDVFVAHEWEGRDFTDIALETGINVNTLISRKRYAVKHLRSRLDAIYQEFRNR